MMVDCSCYTITFTAPLYFRVAIELFSDGCLHTVSYAVRCATLPHSRYMQIAFCTAKRAINKSASSSLHPPAFQIYQFTNTLVSGIALNLPNKYTWRTECVAAYCIHNINRIFPSNMMLNVAELEGWSVCSNGNTMKIDKAACVRTLRSCFFV